MARCGQRVKGGLYLRGLLLEGRRKSMQLMAERLGIDHQRLQQFMTSSTWPVEDVRARLARRAVRAVGPEVWAVDDTGFPKDGKASPGVARQYSGTLGKVGNCQIGVSVHALSDTASCPLSWRLFLPESWDGPQAAARRAACRIPEDAYRERTDTALGISSGGYMPALREAERAGATAIWVHTHPAPGSAPLPSRRDAVVDAQLAATFRTRSGSGLYGSLIVAPHEGGMTFTGHIEGEHQAAIDRIFIAGQTFRLLRSFDSGTPDLPGLHDCQIRAFGTEIQRVLGELHVAVVGAGGTGSAVAEQLVRLGIRRLTLIDPDTLSVSNLTRVYGSTPADVGRPKVHVLADHLTRIADGVTVEAVVGSVSRRKIAQHVVGADVVFGCTDDEAGRMRLSRFSHAYLTPLIDCGVKITATPPGPDPGHHRPHHRPPPRRRLPAVSWAGHSRAGSRPGTPG
ncbi:transposase [Kitasatospora sp. NPDC088548]|uniref:IS701 family transposase n=1 Tax=Kitasatospora sp. NPDC088548 TaxID=3364075 RepID=UPI00382ED236